MEYLGGNPNGLNQLSSSLIALYVSGSKIANFTSESVNVVGNFTASGIQTNLIVSQSNSPISVVGNVKITGSLNISSSISASIFQGDGSGLFNINASAIGDLAQLKSGSAIAQISPNKGLIVNTGVSVDNFLIVSGSGIFKGDIQVAGKVTTTELHTTFISSSVIFSSGSNKFGDQSSDKHEFTGSIVMTGSLVVNGDSVNIGTLNSFTASQLGVNVGNSIVTASFNSFSSLSASDLKQGEKSKRDLQGLFFGNDL